MTVKTVATWRSGLGIFKADAQKVADEIGAIGEEVTPAQILEKARDSKTELHKCFEWDDTKAAEKYRLYQARQVVCNLVFKEVEEKEESVPRRIFHRTENTGGYKPLELIVKNPTEYEKLLEQAMAELRSFKAKYHSLSELEDILALID